MKKILIIVAVLVVGGFSAVIMSGPSNNLPQLQRGVDFMSTYQKSGDSVLLDVRTPGEFRGGHLSGARNVDFSNPSFLSEIQRLDKERTYFVYCHSGNRSGQAVAMMRREGFQNIYELRGGIASNEGTIKLVTDVP